MLINNEFDEFSAVLQKIFAPVRKIWFYFMLPNKAEVHYQELSFHDVTSLSGIYEKGSPATW